MLGGGREEGSVGESPRFLFFTLSLFSSKNKFFPFLSHLALSSLRSAIAFAAEIKWRPPLLFLLAFARLEPHLSLADACGGEWQNEAHTEQGASFLFLLRPNATSTSVLTIKSIFFFVISLSQLHAGLAFERRRSTGD